MPWSRDSNDMLQWEGLTVVKGWGLIVGVEPTIHGITLIIHSSQDVYNKDDCLLYMYGLYSCSPNSCCLTGFKSVALNIFKLHDHQIHSV